jgi:dihydroorotase
LPVDLVLKNAKIHTRSEVVQAGLAIDGGRIAKIAKDTNLPSASKKMDLEGLLVLPGLIDAHVHLRDQKLEYKEDFFTGTAAAANGGVTSVIDMPNNKPVTMSLESLRERMNIAAQKSIVNVAFFSAFPERNDEMRRIVEEGAKAFKLFMSEKIGGLDPNDDEALTQTFKETVNLNVPVDVHAEDEALLNHALMKMEEKRNNSVDAYLGVHSPDVEVKAVNRILEITRKSNARAHICHISTGKGIEAISSAKSDRLPITCEVTPHHLLLSSHQLKNLGAVALTNPPLRPEQDIRSLWSAIQRGLVDILVSDHAPHAIEEKEEKSIFEAAPGISGIETLLPLMLTQVNNGRLSLSALVRMTSAKPAEIFGIKGRGGLEEGNYADLVVVNLKEEWRIDSSKFCSKANFSPFNGWQVKGKPLKTFVNGHLVIDEGEIIGKPGDGWIVQ